MPFCMQGTFCIPWPHQCITSQVNHWPNESVLSAFKQLKYLKKMLTSVLVGCCTAGCCTCVWKKMTIFLASWHQLDWKCFFLLWGLQQGICNPDFTISGYTDGRFVFSLLPHVLTTFVVKLLLRRCLTNLLALRFYYIISMPQMYALVIKHFLTSKHFSHPGALIQSLTNRNNDMHGN